MLITQHTMATNDNENLLKIPKLELHAHLNGSLSEETIKKLNGCGNEETGIQIDQTNFKDLNSCFEIFSIAHKATKNFNAVRLATLWTIQEFAEDGVVYLELRSTPRQEGSTMSKEMYLTAIVDAIFEAQTSEPGIVVTLLVSVNRSEGVDKAEENIDLAIEFSRKHPAIVVGVDLSGNPTAGKFKEFLPALKRARRSGLKLTIHCGEVENPEEVDEILDFGADRLGHVTCLTDAQLKRLKSEKTPVELCLSSNVLCGTVPDFASHHLKHFLEDHPFILGTDDKGVFDTCLSKEYKIVQEHYRLSLEKLWHMNYDAVNFIFASNDIKEKLRTNWRKKLEDQQPRSSPTTRDEMTLEN